MEKQTQGAWLLHHSKSLEGVHGTGAAELENIAYAGKVGRFLNVLHRDDEEEFALRIDKGRVETLARLNGIDRATRTEGLRELEDRGLIELASDGSVTLLGVTSLKVLEAAAEIFSGTEPAAPELAVLALSERVSVRPAERKEVTEYLSDIHKLTFKRVAGLIDLSRNAGLIDAEQDKELEILFNGHNFRHRDRAKRAYYLLSGLSATDSARVGELDETLRAAGTIEDKRAGLVIGDDLLRRMLQIGYFDRLEVSNSTEAIGYVALPDAFQRYGRPFEEDPVDDAKALLASLTYGMERSAQERGRITLPHLLLGKMLRGEWVGPASAIGEDYRELERRGVVQVRPAAGARCYMKLLKHDVGRLALAIINGTGAAPEAALLLPVKAATHFVGPEHNRQDIRKGVRLEDRTFNVEALERLRTGEA